VFDEAELNWLLDITFLKAGKDFNEARAMGVAVEDKTQWPH
jgi:hypothetical protein